MLGNWCTGGEVTTGDWPTWFDYRPIHRLRPAGCLLIMDSITGVDGSVYT